MTLCNGLQSSADKLSAWALMTGIAQVSTVILVNHNRLYWNDRVIRAEANIPIEASSFWRRV